MSRAWCPKRVYSSPWHLLIDCGTPLNGWVATELFIPFARGYDYRMSHYDSTQAYPRDLVGYGPKPPHAQWPGQARVAVLQNDTADTLAARVLVQEHRLYPQVLRRFALGQRERIDLP